MAKIVNIHAAKTHFSKLVEEVEAGAEITIARSGKPVMRLVKYVDEPVQRRMGFAQGLVSDLSIEDWDAIDDEFNSLFKGN